MEIEEDQEEIPMPLNSAYPGGRAHVHVSNMFHQYHYHDHHHHHHDDDDDGDDDDPSSNGHMPITPNHHDHVLMSNNNNNNNHDHHHQEVINYKECLKNHAATMGGNVRDGCGEFMASSDNTLICSVCNCHRNFHRKEVEGGSTDQPWRGKKVITLGHHHHKTMLSPAIIPYNMGPLLVYSSDQSDGQDEAGGGGTGHASHGVAYRGFSPPQPQQHHHKKRFRTKFTPEQKEKMFGFAERIGWTIQRQEESEIQRFCQEIGVKRKVLKVWLHNNKHNLSKRSSCLAISGCEDEKH